MTMIHPLIIHILYLCSCAITKIILLISNCSLKQAKPQESKLQNHITLKACRATKTTIINMKMTES